MKTKLMVITILGLILFGVLFMQCTHVLFIDCIGAAAVLAGGDIAAYDCIKRKNRAALIPLAISIITFIITGVIPFEGSILVAAFGFIALGLYIYLTYFLSRRKSATEKH